jgi:hypothetical protein
MREAQAVLFDDDGVDLRLVCFEIIRGVYSSGT